MSEERFSSGAIEHPKVTGCIDPGQGSVDGSEFGIVEFAEGLAAEKEAFREAGQQSAVRCEGGVDRIETCAQGADMVLRSGVFLVDIQTNQMHGLDSSVNPSCQQSLLPKILVTNQQRFGEGGANAVLGRLNGYDSTGSQAG